MCGIAALFAYRPGVAGVDRLELRTIRDRMASRGPDGCGEWFSADGRTALGHRRLSIIDLSETGAQPMASEDGAIVLSFNGEIYNYQALRASLEAEGCRFRSASDTEVILQLYEREGPEGFVRLRGMFALSLWDGRRKGLLLARDPFGIKPLYYADDGATLRVASQVRALRAGAHVSSDPDPAAVAGFFLWGSIPEPHTLYREIRAMPAGHTMWIDGNGPADPQPFYRLPALYAGIGRRRPGVDPEEIHQIFLDTMRHHLVADVPVGAFLSAGIDSTALVGLARELTTGPLRTVTLGFEEFAGTDLDESRAAEETARRLDTDHETRVISRDRFLAEIPELLDAMDQPSVDGVNSYFVSQAAHEAGLKVALSGLGGDELLAGYPSFTSVPRMAAISAFLRPVPGLRRVARPLLETLLPARVPRRYAGVLEYGGGWSGAYRLRRGLFAPWELPQLIGEDLAREGLVRLDTNAAIARCLDPSPKGARDIVSLMEASLYMRNQLLRDTDWGSMAHSLEVRVPLVDVVLWRRLAETLGPSSPLRTKTLLAMAPRPPLPESLQRRRKTGFAVPLWDWIGGSARLDAWRAVPALQGPGFQGMRRWGFTVFRHFTEGLLPSS